MSMMPFDDPSLDPISRLLRTIGLARWNDPEMREKLPHRPGDPETRIPLPESANAPVEMMPLPATREENLQPTPLPATRNEPIQMTPLPAPGAFPSAVSVFGPQQRAIEEYVRQQAGANKRLDQMRSDFLKSTQPTTWDKLSDIVHQWSVGSAAANAAKHASAGGVIYNQNPSATDFVRALNAGHQSELEQRRLRHANARAAYETGTQGVIREQQQQLQNLGLSQGLANSMIQYGLNTAKHQLELAKFGQDQVKAFNDMIEKTVPNPEGRAKVMQTFLTQADPRAPLATNIRTLNAIVVEAQKQGVQISDKDKWVTVGEGEDAELRNVTTGDRKAAPNAGATGKVRDKFFESLGNINTDPTIREAQKANNDYSTARNLAVEGVRENNPTKVLTSVQTMVKAFSGLAATDKEFARSAAGSLSSLQRLEQQLLTELNKGVMSPERLKQFVDTTDTLVDANNGLIRQRVGGHANTFKSFNLAHPENRRMADPDIERGFNADGLTLSLPAFEAPARGPQGGPPKIIGSRVLDGKLYYQTKDGWFEANQ